MPDEKKFPGLSFAEPVWAKDIPEGEFISHFPSFRAGLYFDLFEECYWPSPRTGDIKYYLYDPIKHGANPDGKYPVILFFHGSGNSLDGQVVINYSMAEPYASPAYQETIGGAYILVPVANETRNAEGRIENGWGTDYCEPIIELKTKFCEEHKANVGKSFFMGTSAGGFMVWELLKGYSDKMDVAVPISGGIIPDEEKLSEIRANGTLILSMHGKHDELVPYDEVVTPHLDKLKKFDNIILYHPDWVRNGDGGIAQMNPWVEMGQHCLNNQVTANLVYDNGKSYDEELFPDGMTGWIRDHK